MISATRCSCYIQCLGCRSTYSNTQNRVTVCAIRRTGYYIWIRRIFIRLQIGAGICVSTPSGAGEPPQAKCGSANIRLNLTTDKQLLQTIQVVLCVCAILQDKTPPPRSGTTLAEQMYVNVQ